LTLNYDSAVEGISIICDTVTSYWRFMSIDGLFYVFIVIS